MLYICTFVNETLWAILKNGSGYKRTDHPKINYEKISIIITKFEFINKIKN